MNKKSLNEALLIISVYKLPDICVMLLNNGADIKHLPRQWKHL